MDAHKETPSSLPESAEQFRAIGTIKTARGMEGEVKVKPFDTDPDWLDSLKEVTLTAPKRAPVHVKIQWIKAQGELLRIKFVGIDTRDQAESLQGMKLTVLQSDLPLPQEDEFYVDQLEGMLVQSLDSDRPLGSVHEVVSAKTGDFLEVMPVGEGQSVMVPFQDAFVAKIDKTTDTIFITGLDSLFE